LSERRLACAAMANSPIPPTDSTPPGQSAAEGPARLDFIPHRLLHETVKKAFQKTPATGASVALVQHGQLICRATVGKCPCEIGATINLASGLTGLCASSGIMQSCMNTDLDSRVDGEACRELGIGAIIVVPLFHRDRLLGLMEVFSERPYTFGMRDLNALEELAQTFVAEVRSVAGSAGNGENDGLGAASKRLRGGQFHFSGTRKVTLLSLAVIACFLIGLRWGWKPVDLMANSPKGQVTLISAVATVPAPLSRSRLVEGALLHRVDPIYPTEALRRSIQGRVSVQVRINKDGLVYDAKATQDDPVLAQSAVQAVREWRFTPYRINDKPFDVAAQITFDFNLAK